MKLKKAGESTSQVEITNISSQGVWIDVKDKEYFMSYEEFPWFQDAKVKDILEVQLLHDHHLRWESLDVDLDIDSLKNPQSYPLLYQ